MKRLLILVAALALLGSACGGSSNSEVASLDDADSEFRRAVEDASSAVDDEAALLAFALCMREEGISGFPDPVLGADGSVDFFSADGDPFADVDNDAAEAAVNACIGELEGVAFAPGGSAFDVTAMQDRFVEFAQCMRDNGIEFDDPDLSGLASGELSNPFADIDLSDPKIAAVVDECQTVFSDLGIPGFGG